MPKTFLIATMAIVGLFAQPQEVFACSCIGFEDAEQRYAASYQNADTIIQGSAISMREVDRSIIYTISVEKVWKGKANAYIDINTANNSAACGITLPLNESSIIFINTYEGTYNTGLCSGTVTADTATELTTWLRSYEEEPEEIDHSCDPYICDNGEQHPSCTEDGSQITYIVNPCQFSNDDEEEEQEQDIFSDVPSSHPNAKAITFVRNEGIVKGYNDSTYRPDQTINRAEFTKIIVAANFSQEVIDNCESTDLFTDVVQKDWYADYVCIGKSEEVIAGYDDGSFRPSNPVNFAEASKIVINAFLISTDPKDHLDVWWKPYVFALSRIGGLPPSFTDPNQLLTRGEMAEIIYRVMTGM